MLSPDEMPRETRALRAAPTDPSDGLRIGRDGRSLYLERGAAEAALSAKRTCEGGPGEPGGSPDGSEDEEPPLDALRGRG